MSSFLRTHLAALRGQFSTAALILSVIALVAALAGGALAANGSARYARTKVVKGPAGKPGKEGLPGPEGKQGPAGTAGLPGAAGAAGKGIVVGSAPSCEEGGTSFEIEGSPSSKHVVCNGIEGPPGSKGEEGEEGERGENGQTGFTETLPSGQTETGAWISPAIKKVEESEEIREQVAISLSDPAAQPAGIRRPALRHQGRTGKPLLFDLPRDRGSAESGARQPLHLRGRGRSRNRRRRSRALRRSRQAPRLPSPRSRHRGRRSVHRLRRTPSSEAARLSGSWAVTAP